MKYTFAAILVAITASCTHRAVEKEAAPGRPQSFILRPAETEESNAYGVMFDVERLPDVDVPKVGKVAAISFIGRKFPPEHKFILGCQHMFGPIVPLYEYEADDDGMLGRQVPEGTIMLENEVRLAFDHYRGQPLRYWLYSRDGKVRLSRLIVPYPIQTSGRDGATVALRRLTADAKLMLCEGTDFLPDEVVLVTTQAGKSVVANIPIVCTNGRFSMALEPGLTGKSGGKALIEIKRSYEKLLLEYDWGCDAVNPKGVLAPSRYVDPETLLKMSLESTDKK